MGLGEARREGETQGRASLDCVVLEWLRDRHSPKVTKLGSGGRAPGRRRRRRTMC